MVLFNKIVEVLYLSQFTAFWNVSCCLEEVKDDLAWLEEVSPSIQKLQQAVHEFHVYITTNQSFLVNYGDRYRNGETISSAFVESTVNEIISKRFAKKTADAMDKKRCATPSASAHPSAQSHPSRSLLSLVSVSGRESISIWGGDDQLTSTRFGMLSIIPHRDLVGTKNSGEPEFQDEAFNGEYTL